MSERLSDWQVSEILRTYEGPEYAVMVLAREVQERRAIEAKLRELHHTEVMGFKGGTRYWCFECGGTWPCPTIRLLDGEP